MVLFASFVSKIFWFFFLKFYFINYLKAKLVLVSFGIAVLWILIHIYIDLCNFHYNQDTEHLHNVLTLLHNSVSELSFISATFSC